jgi:hypothetical protein
MIYPSLTVESMIEQLQTEVSLLQQLHILSQTEYLILEKENFNELKELVEIKEAIVQQIAHQEDHLTRTMRASESLLSNASAQHQERISILKQEALALLEHIGRVEARNRLYVDRFKTEAIHSSYTLYQNRRLHQTYDSQQTIPTLISQLAD